MHDRQLQTLQQNMIVLKVIRVECQLFRNTLRDSSLIWSLNKMFFILT